MSFVVNSQYGRVSLLDGLTPDDLGQSVTGSAPCNEREMTSCTLSSPSARYKCLVCCKIFSSAGHLNRHSTMHTGVKRFECPFPGCGKQCSRSDNLVQHFRLHLSESLRAEINSIVRGLMEDMRAKETQSHSAKHDDGSLRQQQPMLTSHCESPVTVRGRAKPTALQTGHRSASLSSTSSSSPGPASPLPFPWEPPGRMSATQSLSWDELGSNRWPSKIKISYARAE
ncbi:hypothetical protein DACRYDRAFT_20823 [Dacryopinax primogenitus]|uniref:C2H2-type domain-containing protein n=1 Tax=Dacryopinax primogenitus (strain DJM 731) TaxID=1858805 RepID=M5G6A5_DACPD|nr:uncharacterized protein DACRYDRAFT_20823 [Dacryopinax primogenitus]EJU04219.1 hypothetical protein DACRYDRAFT_20823 [Dacryopinax primogenitus]